MNIAFDFITLYQPTGAGEYIRRIFFSFLDYLKLNNISDKNIFAVYDSSKGIYYEDMKRNASFSVDVTFIDVASFSSIDIALSDYCMDTFFIGCAQYLGVYSRFERISCRVICVVHDLSYEESFYNNIQPFQVLTHPVFRQERLKQSPGWKLLLNPRSATMRYIRWYFSSRKNACWERDLTRIERVFGLLQNNSQVRIIAVSEYTKNSIVFNFGISPDNIQVLYSPERIFHSSSPLVINDRLKHFIDSRKKYYLMVSAGRIEKNAYKALKAFEQYAERNKDVYLLTIGYKHELFPNHIDFDFLNDAELSLCYAHCYAFLYPSIFEGFGYPPIEAMHYKKPVLCSNVCSMPEVLGSAPIYFSPIYMSDIYRALTILNDSNYADYSIKSKLQYNLVKKRQENDLKTIIEIILS